MTKREMFNHLSEAYDIINKTNLVMFKWTLTESTPTDFVSDSISSFGYQPEDFYTGEHHDYWTFVYEPDRENAKNLLYRAREQDQQNFKNQYRVVCKNGDVRWVEEWVVHERNEKGELTMEKGFIRDIHESVLLSEQLKESEMRYKALFENASALIFTINQKGLITNHNQAFNDALNLIKDRQVCNINEHMILLSNSDQDLYELCINNNGRSIEIGIQDGLNQVKYIELSYRIIHKIQEIHCVGIDVTERKLAAEKIKYLTEHDTLTGLYNRMYFDHYLESYAEDERPVSIVVGDVNGLKMVNDAFGHKLGDALLQQVAQILTSVFSNRGDILARLSGDEFAVITERKNITHLLQTVHKKCQEIENFPFKIDISLGYSSRKRGNIGIESIFRDADHQMYKHKLKTSKHIKATLIKYLQQRLSEESLETVEHAERIKIISEKVGRVLHLSDTSMEELDLTAIMHDIGMISVSKAILDKSSKLSTREVKEIQRHAEIGYHLLIASPNLASIGEYVLSHHENYDGTGYPQGLSGSDIPLVSRIIAVVDAYEALVHERCYRPKRSHEEAISEILSLSGTRYDPSIVHAFLKVMSPGELIIQHL